MKIGEKIAFGSLIVGIIGVTILLIQTLLKLEMNDLNIAFHIKLLYFISYLMVILVGIIMFKVFTNGKEKPKRKKRKLNKRKKH